MVDTTAPAARLRVRALARLVDLQASEAAGFASATGRRRARKPHGSRGGRASYATGSTDTRMMASTTSVKFFCTKGKPPKKKPAALNDTVHNAAPACQRGGCLSRCAAGAHRRRACVPRCRRGRLRTSWSQRQPRTARTCARWARSAPSQSAARRGGARQRQRRLRSAARWQAGLSGGVCVWRAAQQLRAVLAPYLAKKASVLSRYSFLKMLLCCVNALAPSQLPARRHPHARSAHAAVVGVQRARRQLRGASRRGAPTA